uniref:Uncharacterized protein n=1 Tax=Ciona savignyi TaxID=51511 RepID=H2ZD40_CIOSA
DHIAHTSKKSGRVVIDLIAFHFNKGQEADIVARSSRNYKELNCKVYNSAKRPRWKKIS